MMLRHHLPCAIGALFSLLALPGCDWDEFDPRLEDGGGPATDSDCGRIDALHDDFEAAERDFAWDSGGYSGTSSAAQSGGQAVLLADATSEARAYYVTRRLYDFRQGALAVEVPQVPAATSAAVTELRVQRDDYHQLMFHLEGPDLVLISRLGASAEVGRVPYDPVAHRWWRIRHQGDQIYWEASPEGKSWTELGRRAASAAFDLRYVQVVLWVSHGPNNLGGEAHFDNVAGSGPGNGGWCKASALHEDFAALEPGDEWLFITGSYDAIGRQYGGELVITPAADTENSRYEYGSSRFYDLSGSSIGFELTGVPHTPAEVYLHADADGGWLRIALGEDEQVHCSYYADETSNEVAAVPFSPTEHRWWRIREAGNEVLWEASANGTDYQQLGSVSPVPLDVDRVGVRFGAATPTANPDPGQARIDSYNLGPAQ